MSIMRKKEKIQEVAVKPFNTGVAAKDIKLQDIVAEIRAALQGAAQNYLRIGFALKFAKETKLYQEEGFKNINEFARSYFQITQSKVSRLVKVSREFCFEDRPELLPQYAPYNLSQLFELLSIRPEDRKQINPKMTVSEIQDWKRAQKEKVQGKAPEEKAAQGEAADMASFSQYILPIVEKGWQVKLPHLKDDNERREWLQDVESWGIWYIDPNVKVEYCKYDFTDGSQLVAMRHKDITSCPGERIYSKKIRYHMFFSDDYMAKHQDELTDHINDGIFDATPMDMIIKFLADMQEEDGSSTEPDREDESGMDVEYRPNEYIMVEFDPDHPERAESYAGREYAEFYEKKGYIPKYFNPKNHKEIVDYTQTLTTSSGSATGMGSIDFFDAVKETAVIINDEKMDEETACHLIGKILSVASPQERKKVEELLGLDSA